MIEAMAGTERPIGVGELARQVGLPKSTVQRILHTLNEVGWVDVVTEPTTRWTLTNRMATLFGVPPRHPDLRSAALPHMRTLSEQTHEAIHLSTVDRVHWTSVLIERIDSTFPVRTHNELGTVAPLHAGAAGKAILAASTDQDIEHVIEQGLPQMASGTITDGNALRADLADIRRVGYSVSHGEWRSGVQALGAVILDRHGAPAAALVISMPDARFREDRVPEWGQMVMEASQATTRDWLRA